MSANTFGVSIHVTEEEFQLLVHVPSEIDAGWTDPEAFQSLVADVLWERLDRRAVFETIATEHDVGDTVTLGTVTLTPDGTVADYTFAPRFEEATSSPNRH
ncbi:hypothetical protein [Halorubrum vacuolatum]|uniref:DUF8124 domain-containing protein n=1 Tax=Halorubrum vacuolatum TaxID=63740 RepID=A0A238VFM8_HALVU|nr:hypothetical protein [Halorubrum vacuolatum]SNR32887.1 hypothetical protein SAMN06264855_102359 [Halorubrum vacuolatum]